jgi:hypothetical protein
MKKLSIEFSENHPLIVRMLSPACDSSTVERPGRPESGEAAAVRNAVFIPGSFPNDITF